MGSNVENDGSCVLGEGIEAFPHYTACSVRAQDELSHDGKGCCTRELIFKEGFVDGPDGAFHSSLFWQEPKICLGRVVRELENDAMYESWKPWAVISLGPDSSKLLPLLVAILGTATFPRIGQQDGVVVEGSVNC